MPPVRARAGMRPPRRREGRREGLSNGSWRLLHQAATTESVAAQAATIGRVAAQAATIGRVAAQAPGFEMQAPCPPRGADAKSLHSATLAPARTAVSAWDHLRVGLTLSSCR